MLFVTGGAGFIGSNFVLRWIKDEKSPLVNLDKLTYAGNLDNLKSVHKNRFHTFVYGDICDKKLIRDLFKIYEPIGIVHFAAESHVDRSIANSKDFIRTNVIGTCNLLEQSLHYWLKLSEDKQKAFRFVYVSTDEVYGSIAQDKKPVTEEAPYLPNSPYSASKASAGHFVRAYHSTYGLPTITTLGSNTFGAHQFPEKLIPLVILRALQEKQIPIYGSGNQIRDWIFVEDHCLAIKAALQRGIPGENYNIASGISLTNLQLVTKMCDILDQMIPRESGNSYKELIVYVKDRPGHDFRYAMNTHKIQKELGWSCSNSFDEQLHQTITWYLDRYKKMEKR